jgi:phage host-nuclease inhibitor protein Gam
MSKPVIDNKALELVQAAAAVQEPLDADAIVATGAWSPKNKNDVEWALEEAARSQGEIDAINAQLKDLIARATIRAGQLMLTAENRKAFFLGRVAEWAAPRREELLVGKKKSVDFLAGRVGWRLKTGRLVVTEKLALNEWLADQEPRFYRVVLEPQMKELQAQTKIDGIIPPGCTYNEEMDELFVEANGIPELPAAKKELAP